MLAHNTDPSKAEARKASARKAAATKRANPETVAKMREAGRRVGAKNIAATRTAEARAKAGKAISARKLAHVPEAYRDLYISLTRPGETAASRLAMVLDQQRRDQERERARRVEMTPFERQMEALRNGARLVSKVMPTREHPFTLGGVASGSL